MRQDFMAKKRKHETSHDRNTKHIPYGSKKGLHWCPDCDRALVGTVSKKAERQKAKKEIKKAIEE